MYVRRFLAAFKAFGSIGKSQAMSIVGALHTDKTGEFLSHEFSELMDDELIHHTTCPPHVHQLNGVAERAVRTIMEVLRADLVASNSPTAHRFLAVRSTARRQYTEQDNWPAAT